MVRKQTWILLVVFAVLLGGAFYLQKNPLPSSSGTETPSPTALARLLKEGWNTSDIVWMELKGKQSSAIQLSRDNQGVWTLTPEAATVDPGKAEEIRTQIADMRALANLPASFALDAAGFSAPAYILTIKNTQGQQSVIRIGNETPTATGYYAQVDDQAPVVIDKTVIDNVTGKLAKENLMPATATPQAEKVTPNPTIEQQQTPTPK
jgi:hypothetical protein